MKIVWNSNGKGENNNKKQGGKKGTKKEKKNKENKTKLKWSGNQIKKIRRERRDRGTGVRAIKTERERGRKNKTNSLPGRTINRKSHFLFLLLYLLLPYSK